MSANPAAQITQKYHIDVHVSDENGTTVVHCHPHKAEMIQGARDLKVEFHLKHGATEGWAFPPTKDSDWDFYGIDIEGGDDGQFYDAGCEAGDGPLHKVWVYDQNTNNTKYQYTVTVINTKTGEKARVDPSIVNRSDMATPGARR